MVRTFYAWGDSVDSSFLTSPDDLRFVNSCPFRRARPALFVYDDHGKRLGCRSRALDRAPNNHESLDSPAIPTWNITWMLFGQGFHGIVPFRRGAAIMAMTRDAKGGNASNCGSPDRKAVMHSRAVAMTLLTFC